MLTTCQARVLSFRDPAGRIAIFDNRVFRIVAPEGNANLEAYLSSPSIQAAVGQGSIVSTRRLEANESEEILDSLGLAGDAIPWIVLEHERIPFPSFAYEWPAEMLAASAQLTLDFADQLLSEGLGVKDATPYNILFRGAQPVFVDVLSIEPRRKTDPVWLPYAQFMRTFLLPLLAHKYLGQPLDSIFMTRRDGLEPEEVYEWASWWRRANPALFATVSFPKWLSGKAQAEHDRLYIQRTESPQKVNFILRSMFKRLRRSVKRALAEPKRSKWSEYVSQATHYSSQQANIKAEGVKKFLRDFRPASVLDVGCNTGVFSFMAADVAKEVVAIDSDASVVGRVWRQAQEQHPNVLPLKVDLARPTPSVGWRNGENPSFLERAAGHFEAVMMLAVIHHMLVSERVPLQDICSLAADLTRDLWLVEYVAPDDPMFVKLTRGREHLHSGLNPLIFETACSKQFALISKDPIPGSGRILYVWRKRGT